MISAKVILDSINPDGKRLTTLEFVLPRPYLSELNTHREQSKSSASTRARPTHKMIQDVLDNPYIPTEFGKNQKGMQAYDMLDPENAEQATKIWLDMRDYLVGVAQKLSDLGVHKQHAGRPLEVVSYHKTVISATSFDNFIFLRDHHAAQPEMQTLAKRAREALDNSQPKLLGFGEWHTPYLPDKEELIEQIKMDPTADIQQSLCEISSGRCARTSYLTQDGVRDASKDLELFQRLIEGMKTNEPIHLSPLEHVAVSDPVGSGNFKGWKQLRKFYETP